MLKNLGIQIIWNINWIFITNWKKKNLQNHRKKSNNDGIRSEKERSGEFFFINFQGAYWRTRD